MYSCICGYICPRAHAMWRLVVYIKCLPLSFLFMCVSAWVFVHVYVEGCMILCVCGSQQRVPDLSELELQVFGLLYGCWHLISSLHDCIASVLNYLFSPLIFWDMVSQLNLELTDCLEWLARKSLGSFCLQLPSTVICTHCHTWLFMWVLWIQTQVFIFKHFSPRATTPLSPGMPFFKTQQ